LWKAKQSHWRPTERDIVKVWTPVNRPFLQTLFFFALTNLLIPGVISPAAGQTAKPPQQEPEKPARGQADAAYQKGMQLLQQKQYSDALEQFQSVERDAPQSPQGPSGQGIALALMGKPQLAVQALKKALTIDPSYWVARRELGIVYWSQGLRAEAARELQPVVEFHPDDEAGNVILSRYEFGQNHYALALHYLSRVPAQVTADAGLSLMAAKAQLKTRQTATAVQTLKGLIGRPGLTNPQIFGLAWLLGQAHLYKESIRTFNQLPPSFPNDFSHNYGLALAYFGDGQYGQCINTLASLLKHGNTSAETYSLLGVAEEKAGQTKEAYDAFRQGILNNPKDPQNYLDIATLACQHLNYDLAIRILTSGIALIPASHELILSRGIARTLKGQFKDAEQDYEQAIRMAPQDSGNYIALGLSKLEWGDLDGAIGAMQKAAELQPEDPRPYYFQTEALLQKGVAPGAPGFGQARKAIDTSLSLDPDQPGAYADRARLELLSGQINAAISDLERARVENPGSQSIAYLLAQSYRQNGQKQKGDAIFAQVREAREQESKQFARESLTQALVVISQPNH